MVDDAAEAVAPVGENPREIGAEEAVDEENTGDDHQRPTHGPPGGFQDEYDGRDPHDEVQAGRVADPPYQLLIEQGDVDDGRPGHHR